MTGYLPPGMKALFSPRPPLPHFTPLDRDNQERRGPTLGGLASYVRLFEDPAVAASIPKPETREQRRERIRKERQTAAEERHEALAIERDANKDPNATTDPYKTLFIGRLSYDVTERRLIRECEAFGPVTSVRIVTDSKTGRPRGYAFVEFEREKDMREAYKMLDGLRLEGRRILVDVERGRTVKGFRPRRLGGGLGGTTRTVGGAPASRSGAPYASTPSAPRAMSPPRDGAYSGGGRPRDDRSRPYPAVGGGYRGGYDSGEPRSMDRPRP